MREIGRERRDDANKCSRRGVFKLEDRAGRGGGEEHLGLGADADGDAELLSLLLGHAVDGEQVAGHQPDGDVPLVHDHHPVEGDVPVALELGDHDTRGHVPAAVLREVLGDGQGGEIQGQLALGELRVVDDLAGDRVVDRLEDVVDDAVLRDVQRRGHLLPGGEPVPDGLPAVEVLEDDGPGLVL